MSDKINPVRPGERLKADTINRIIKRVDAIGSPQVSTTAARQEAAPGTSDNIILVKNNTENQLLKGNIISLGNILEPVDMEQAPDTIVYNAVKPDPELPFAILIEHVKPGQLASALIYGRIQTRIEIMDEDDLYADIKEGDCTVLESCAAGPCQILWRTTGAVAIAEIQFPIAKPQVEIQGGNFRQHSHASNSFEDGGFSFSVFHPGCSCPQLPWQ